MATTALTVQEFLRHKFREDERVELVGGEVVPMGTAGFRHEKVKANILRALVVYLHQNAVGEAYSDTMYRLGEAEARIPDVSVLLRDQIPVPACDDLLEFAPALAVEVVSSDSAADLERKVELYLEKGSRSVWVVYPEQRTARVFDPTGASRLLREQDRIELDWLPGFSVSVAEFFEGL